MSLSIFLLWLVSIPFTIHAVPGPSEFAVNCGGSETLTVDDITWTNDDGYINTGSKATLNIPDLMPVLTTLRFFPDKSAKKYCYEISPVIRGGKYLIRTMYYYGGFDGGKTPPVFDQIIEGTKWGSVNTSEDYANGLSSYYEIIVAASEKRLRICLARNENTTGDPFISALEIVNLHNTVYNSTDFRKFALSTIARNSFGYKGQPIRFPDDQFNRYWQPFTDSNPTFTSQTIVSSTNFWNLPPAKVFENGVTASRGKTLDVQWPTGALPSGNYYISLYFQDNRSPSPYSWRVFDVSVNGKLFYKALKVSTSGVTVFSTLWPLAGLTNVSLVPDVKAPVGPVINAAEILQVVPLGKRTVSRDVKALEKLARSLKNPPPDWRGDPCLPGENGWTGITCSVRKYAAVTAVNLTGLGLSGDLSPSINRLAALTSLSLGDNKLTGPIPDMSHLKKLQFLHLENNQFTGRVPDSLGKLPCLLEVHVQHNKLEGPIPDSLKNKKGLTLTS